MKIKLRKEMFAVTALVLCASLFAGCNKNETEPASLDTSTASTSSEKGVTSTVSSVPASSSRTESVVSSAEPAKNSEPVSKPESTTTSEPESTPAPKTESKPESTTTSETESKPTPEPEPEPAPEWTEEPASGAYYINTDYVSAREKALTGSKTVGTFHLNDQVTVVAKTNTGYYKMLNGYFVHGDYLSTTKTEEQKPATSVPFVPTEPTNSSTPKHGDTKYVPDEGLIMYDETLGRWAHDGDIKVENGITYRYDAFTGLWAKVGTGHVSELTPEEKKWYDEHFDEYGNYIP